MSPVRIAAGHGRAVKAIVALAAVSACLGAVAYAATRPERPAADLGGSQAVSVGTQHGAGGDAPRGSGEEPLLRPRFLEFPDGASTASEVQFRFHVPPRERRPLPSPPGPPGEPKPPRPFQCRLDDRDWRSCGSPYRLSGLALGAHVFAVRAVNREDRPGPAVSYSWRQADLVPRVDQVAQVDPKPFEIEARGELEDLYPGYPPQSLPILIANPNSVPIEVTSLTVAIAGDPPDCSAENFALTPSSVSPAVPLAVPANGSVNLPTVSASAPMIGMLNLPVNQDACRGTEIPLVFDGEAHG
jgi:hypothetical protein